MGSENGVSGNPLANQFALVSYIPHPLGLFLDELRLDLVPGCSPHAHVTVLPPRPVKAPQDQAASEILNLASDFSGFEVALGDVEVFPVSKVIYIGLLTGQDELRRMHRAFNRGPVCYQEPFPYHPHVTLAQNFPLDAVDRLMNSAQSAWSRYRGPRNFSVDTLDFVKNMRGNYWIDLASVPLKKLSMV